MRSGDGPPRATGRPGGRAATAASLLVILLVCLFPTSGEVPTSIRLCLICGERGTTEFLLNMVLFLPFGLAVRRMTGSMVWASAAALVVSMGVEALQIWIPGRVPALGDLVANTAGGAMGGALWAQGRRILSPTPRLRGALLAVWAVVAIATLTLPATLFSPAPPPGALFVNWNPAPPTDPSVGPRVVGAWVGDMPAPSRRSEDQSRLRRLLLDGAEIRVQFELGSPSGEPITLFRILDERRDEYLTIRSRGDALHIRLRTRAVEVGLVPLQERLPDALEPYQPGDLVELSVSRAEDSRILFRIGSPSNGPPSTLRIGLRAADGWALLVGNPAGSQRVREIAGLLWLALLGLPLGWWAGARVQVVGLGALLAATLWVVPRGTSLLEPTGSHFAVVLLAPMLAFLVRKLGTKAESEPRRIVPSRPV